MRTKVKYLDGSTIIYDFPVELDLSEGIFSAIAYDEQGRVVFAAYRW